MSNLTLASARAALWKTASKIPFLSKTATDIAEVDAAINAAAERLLLSNCRDSFATARLRVYDEQITLPAPLEGIRSLRLVDEETGCLGAHYQVYSQQAPFASGSCACGGGVRDLGDNFATFRDYDGEFYIRSKTDLTEAGTTLLLRGLDENGEMIYQSNGTEGVSLNLTTADTTTTQKFTFLNSWVKAAATAGMVRLYAVDTTTAEETLILNLRPSKLTSGYRRYYAPFTFGQSVEALCNVAFLTAIADNDLVFPSRLDALKLGMMAINYEDKNDLDNWSKYWTMALDILEKERDKFDGDEVSTVQFSGFEPRGSYLLTWG